MTIESLRAAKARPPGDAWVSSPKSSSGDIPPHVIALTVGFAVGSEIPAEQTIEILEPRVVAAGFGYAAGAADKETYTGCLQSGSISNVAIGPAPSTTCGQATPASSSGRSVGHIRRTSGGEEMVRRGRAGG